MGQKMIILYPVNMDHSVYCGYGSPFIPLQMVTLSPRTVYEPVACFFPNTTRAVWWVCRLRSLCVGCGLWYDKQATSSSAKILSVRTSEAITHPNATGSLSCFICQKTFSCICNESLEKSPPCNKKK